MPKPNRASLRPPGGAGTGTTTLDSGHATGSGEPIEGRVMDPREYAPDTLTPVGDRSTRQPDSPRYPHEFGMRFRAGWAKSTVELAHDPARPWDWWPAAGGSRAGDRLTLSLILTAFTAVTALLMLSLPLGAHLLASGLLVAGATPAAWTLGDRLGQKRRWWYWSEKDGPSQGGGDQLVKGESGYVVAPGVSHWDRDRSWVLMAGVAATMVGWALLAWEGAELVGGSLTLVGLVLTLVWVVMRTSRVAANRLVKEEAGYTPPARAGLTPADLVGVTWKRLVAPDPKQDPMVRTTTKLTGSTLSAPQMLSDGGFTTDVRLPAGNVTWTLVRDQQALIAQAYGLKSTKQVMVKPSRASAGHAELLVWRKDPLLTPRPWRGRTLKGGAVRVCRWRDGADGRWPLWIGSEGVVHGMAVGASGAGKGEALRIVLAEAGTSARYFVVLLSPKGRAGVRGFADTNRVDHVALSTEEIDRALLGVNAVLQARIDHDLGGVEPSRKGLPALLVVFDEVPDHVGGKTDRKRKDSAIDLMARGVKLGRHHLVQWFLTAQQPLVDEVGGSAVRAQLANVFAGRIDDEGGRKSAGGAFQGMDISGLTEKAGFAYHRGLGEERREDECRWDYLDEESLRIYDRERAHNGPTALDPISQAAWDAVMGTTEEDA